MKLTPQKKSFEVPTAVLADAIAAEWVGKKRFEPNAMPLTAMTYAAIDVVEPQREVIVESLLAYAETDLLSYRSENPELQVRQAAGWDPVLTWIRTRYDCTVVVTEGLMPVEQPEATLSALRAILSSMDAYALSAMSVLTQSLGSLLLALAVREGEISAQQSFALSRIDEDFQAEQWGVDDIAAARAEKLEADIRDAARFLGLLTV